MYHKIHNNGIKYKFTATLQTVNRSLISKLAEISQLKFLDIWWMVSSSRNTYDANWSVTG